MVFNQGGFEPYNVVASSVGAASTFGFLATTVYVRNAGTSDVYVSLATTSGTTGGHPIQTLGERYFRSGGYAGISYITTVAGSSAGVAIVAMR